MKAELFARPNLKLILIAAILIVAFDHFLGEPTREDASLFSTSTLTASPIPDSELERLIEQSLYAPTSENYTLISECLRRRGETKQALLYLRKATMAAHLEDQ